MARSNIAGTQEEGESDGGESNADENGEAALSQEKKLEKWSVDGSTTISPAEQQPADTENISALDQSSNAYKAMAKRC